jgi:hypothetical protein
LLKDDEDSVVAICSQCNMVQLIKNKEYEVSANITIKTIPESEKILLKICRENIRKLIPNIDASPSKQKIQEEILQTPTVKIIYTMKTCYVEDIHLIYNAIIGVVCGTIDIIQYQWCQTALATPS